MTDLFTKDLFRIRIIKLNNDDCLIANMFDDGEDIILENPYQITIKISKTDDSRPTCILRPWLPADVLKENITVIKNSTAIPLSDNIQIIEYYKDLIRKQSNKHYKKIDLMNMEPITATIQ